MELNNNEVIGFDEKMLEVPLLQHWHPFESTYHITFYDKFLKY